MITIYLMSKLFKKIIKYGLGGIVGVIIPYLLFVLLGKDTLSGVILFLVCSPAFALFGFALARTIVMRKINILFILASILFIISVIFILYLFVNAYYEDQANISSVNNFTKNLKRNAIKGVTYRAMKKSHGKIIFTTTVRLSFTARDRLFPEGVKG